VCTDRLKRRSKPRHGFLTTHAGLYPQNEPHVKKRGHLEGFWKPSHPQRRTAIFFWIHACELLAAILLHACACSEDATATCCTTMKRRYGAHDRRIADRTLGCVLLSLPAQLHSHPGAGRLTYILTAISSQH